MRLRSHFCVAVLALGVFVSGPVRADSFAETTEVFRNALNPVFFDESYGYAVFPSIGKGGIGIGGARGRGRVYEEGRYVGDTTMTQLTVGFQLGGQAYSQIIFFKDERAFEEFTSGNFEFGAQATAVAITAGASAAATTTGTGVSASGSETAAKAGGDYVRGMAVFTIPKGGLMYEASIGGQKFSYKPVE